MQLNEARTRSELIDQQLHKAGWHAPRVQSEVPVAGYDPKPWNGYTDYSLYDDAGSVIAVIEAKRTSRDPREGEEQLRQYIAEIAKTQSFTPFGFMANGQLTHFWDVEMEHPRLVAKFFEPGDMKRLKFIRENRQPLLQTPINNSIIDRNYQHEAVRRVGERFATGERRALLVMATGTGKTRTTIGLIDVLLRRMWAQNVLFLADRDALVEQALKDGFIAHLPAEPNIRVHTARIDKEKRLYVSTLQTMSRCFEEFSPGFFDVIVFDEAHRSIFNRFAEVIEYFDARMVGLTATPAGFIDRDTFATFHCTDQTPTFLYTYDEALREKRLVPFRVYQAQTGFQRSGIRGTDLSEEDRNALIEQGIDPDDLDIAGSDLEKTASNTDTLRRQWEEIMDVCVKDRAGNLPGKTIVFAISKAHAKRLRDVFEEMYPQHIGVLQLIYNGTERVADGAYGDGLITKFKKQDRPRIAVSVDMLDTGIDVPEVVNLVFMKPVQSQIKLWQMIGRGTRNQEACRFFDRLPGGVKTEFLIIDFWQNEFNKESEDRPSAEIPLLIRLFNTRLDILAATRDNRAGDAHAHAITDCRAMLSRVPQGSFPIRKVWGDVGMAWEDGFWRYLKSADLEFLRLNVAPLLRFVPDVDIAAETFTHKLERLNLQILKGKPSTELMQSIAEDVSLLPQHVLDDVGKKVSVDLALSNDLAVATPAQISRIVTALAPAMFQKRRTASPFLKIDLPDFLAHRGFIEVGAQRDQIYVQEYRERVDKRVLEIASSHIAFIAIREGRAPSDDELVDLERVLKQQLTAEPVHLTPKIARQAYDVELDRRGGFLALMRHLLDLDAIPDYESVVDRAFQTYVTNNHYEGEQIRFLRTVQDKMIEAGPLRLADLYAPPFTSMGRNAVERLFTSEQIDGIVHLTQRLAS